MTAWEALVAKSALTAGTALQHLRSIKETLGTVFLAKSEVVLERMYCIVVEPERPAVVEGFARVLPAATPTHPFTTTDMHFCTSRTPSVFVLLGRKT